MIPILTREQMRAYDAYAIERCQVPGLLLMENAGRGAAELISDQLEGESGPVVIVCGGGNNGGDGFVVARHLLAHGHPTAVFVLAKRGSIGGDAKTNLDALEGLGVAAQFVDDDLDGLTEALGMASLSVDALFGTGLTRDIEGRYLAAVSALNEAECPCIALDIPSGLDANSGAVLGDAVIAAMTITFGHCKLGLLQGAAAVHAGHIEMVGLGIPDAHILDEVGMSATFIDGLAVRATIGARAKSANKYTAGSVLVVAGSEGKSGAALLSARGALRCGAGMVTIASWAGARAAIEGVLDEAMTCELDDSDIAASVDAALEKRKAVAIGPGFGLDDKARQVVDRVALEWDGPVVLDADAISHFAGRAEALRAAAGPRVLTPHSGELARLLGISSAEVEANRYDAVVRASEACGCTVVLKGRHSLIATEGRVELCGPGSAVLATAGSGDVLTGMLGAMLCNTPAHEAAVAAVYLHAVTGDQWSELTGADRGMLASDIAEALPELLGAISDD
jgi:NAD(P)H-hydrate epimerase